MAMGAASILLMMVSLETLLLAAGAGAGGTIRLSSDVGDLVTAMARARARAKHQLRDEERPWGECCDLAVCVKTYPLTCSCFDRVERCSDACKECVETEDSRHVCVDRYRGDPGPSGDPGPRCGDGEDDGGEWSPTPRLARGHRF
ncbi:Bowman-Birk type trypsin inhibitor [Zea mays]|uniref:Bowman-Birk type trypsin inhibitor n=1 Tax=Zea mays TaxID=4577 RepID=A0A1D6MM90_MAIZE|nr:Bowman-Birk type trypsin inhibitor [Zea mays]